MTTVREAAIPIEVKKHAYRQTQDGIVISFVMHPNDVSPELASAPLGTRYMAALVEMNDDNTPKAIIQKKHSLAQQAGILCTDARFAKFLEEQHPDMVKACTEQDDTWTPEVVVRVLCGVKSRAEFDKDDGAAHQWRALKGAYDAWLSL